MSEQIVRKVQPSSKTDKFEQAEQRANAATITAEVQIPAWVYGHFAAAAVVHGHADWRESLVEYLKGSVSEWSTNGYCIEP